MYSLKRGNSDFPKIKCDNEYSIYYFSNSCENITVWRALARLYVVVITTTTGGYVRIVMLVRRSVERVPEVLNDEYSR